VTSGKPCDEVYVSIVDDEESMLLTMFEMLCSVVCSAFAMLIVLSLLYVVLAGIR
jgi:hypothetical protein